MVDITIRIPNPVAPEALGALETRWGADARGIFPTFDTMTPAERLQALLATLLRIYIRNARRETAERAIVVPEPDIVPHAPGPV